MMERYNAVQEDVGSLRLYGCKENLLPASHLDNCRHPARRRHVKASFPHMTLSRSRSTTAPDFRFYRYLSLLSILAVTSCGGGSDSTIPATQSTPDPCLSTQCLIYMRYMSDPILNEQSDIYLVPEDGSAAPLRLTSNSMDEYVERILTDGSLLVASSDGDAYHLSIINPQGKVLTQIGSGTTSDLYAVVLNDGRILFERETSSGTQQAATNLYVINNDGSGETALTFTTTHTNNYRFLTSDGAAIVERTSTTGSGEADIYRVDLDGSGETPLTITPEQEFIRAVTPDNWVVYGRYDTVNRQDVMSVRTDGSQTVSLAATSSIENYAGMTRAGRVLFTRDGNLFAIGGDGSLERSLTQVPAGSSAGLIRELDSGRLLISIRDATTQRRLYTIDADGGNDILISQDDCDSFFPIVSPAGRIVYRAINLTTGDEDLFSINPDGSDLMQLTHTPATAEVLHGATPDSEVVYSQDPSVNALSPLYVVGVTGLSERELAGTTGAQYLMLTPSGRVLFERDGDLYSVSVDGSASAVLLTNEAEQEELWGLYLPGGGPYQ